MITLRSSNLQYQNLENHEPFIIRISTNAMLPEPLRAGVAYLISDEPLPDGFCVYLKVRDPDRKETLPPHVAGVTLPEEFSYLSDGDVIRLSPRGRSIRVLYRKGSEFNHFLLTERCNNYCLMCSQPPKIADDSYIAGEILSTIPLIDPGTKGLGLTGGEPTLLGEGLIKILEACETWLPRTAVHLLSNGRRFSELRFAQQYANVRHHDLMVGIPLYSDLSHLHDFVVQADGAFDETLRGILNLKHLGQRVEIRVVIHKQTYKRLPQLAEFITRNLLFVDHVALMGLELMGFARANLDALWIDPFDYQDELVAAVEQLVAYRMHVSIYNHQLCVLRPNLWRYSRKSISDWKNEYMPECEGCGQRDACGGFFSSAQLKHSAHIRPLSRA
ncbi:His-Xaa-Ser system radical SAM maturase HxsC [bacterium]|nr:MAG: His-Xaa-Ser system radical SAM maturase HxsC [bacterium]